METLKDKEKMKKDKNQNVGSRVVYGHVGNDLAGLGM